MIFVASDIKKSAWSLDVNSIQGICRRYCILFLTDMPFLLDDIFPVVWECFHGSSHVILQQQYDNFPAIMWCLEST
jgi:hypothetical protein